MAYSVPKHLSKPLFKGYFEPVFIDVQSIFKPKAAEIRMIRMRLGFESAYEDSEVRDEALRAYLHLVNDMRSTSVYRPYWGADHLFRACQEA